MYIEEKKIVPLTPKSFLDSMIQLGIIATLVLLSVRVFEPFLNILLAGLILSIMLYPLQQTLAKRLGNRQGLAATLLLLAIVLLIGGPLIVLGNSFAEQILNWQTAYQNNTLTLIKPDPDVAQWPLIGDRLYGAWDQASSNLPDFIQNHQEQIKAAGGWLLSVAKNTIGSVFMLMGALVIAGTMMAWEESGSNALLRILSRVAGPVKGPRLQHLSVAVIRSVASGVFGVAIIQAILFGIGFVLAGIPAAGVLALIVMFIAIIQLPTAFVSLPVIIYIWSTGDSSVTVNAAFTLFFIVAGLADNVLKPLLLGHGVDVPMPIILIGALGGMVASGLIGLFLGAILLAFAYQIFWDWVDEAQLPTAAETMQAVSTNEMTPGQ